MDHLEKIEALRGELLDLSEGVNAIRAKADAEQRELTDEETKESVNLMNRFESVTKDIELRERQVEQATALAASFGRKTTAKGPGESDDGVPPAASQPVYPRAKGADHGKGGFRNFGEFAASVRVASARGGSLDPRLVANAPSTYSSEGVGEDGGFMVPPDFRQEIMTKVMGVDSLLARTDQMTTGSNSVTFPADETTPWASSGGIQAYWGSEGGAINQSKVELAEKQIRLNKLTCLVPVTEELQQDAGTLSGYLNKKVPEKFDYKIAAAIIAGSGVGQPLGIINAPCTVSAAKDTTSSPVQPADTVAYRNIVDMWNRMYAPCRSRAVWLVNPDVEGQLDLMRFSTNRSDEPFPVYLPAGGASATPYATLKGRPVIPHEACSALGDVGDIILADMSQYLTLTKTAGIRQDVSIHLFFDYDVSAYRFIFRVAGMPWWGSAITPPNSSNTRSCFVTLAERS